MSKRTSGVLPLLLRIRCAKAGLQLEVWETYSVNPLKYTLFRTLPIGNKARVLVRRT